MTKRINIIIIFSMLAVVFFNAAILRAEVKNEDKPLKGNWDFKLRKLWEVEKAGNDLLTQIPDIQVDDNGQIYILEWKLYKFFVFDQNGKFLYSFGNRGEGPGEYKMAFSFFLKGQYVIVPDQERTHYFNKDGKYVKSYNYGRQLFPRAFLDESRFLMVQDNDDEKEKSDKLEIFDLNSMNRTVIAEISSEKVLTASQGNLIMKFKDGTTTPMVVAAEHNKNIYFGKNDRYFIKKVDFNGKELLSFSISGRDQKKIPEQVKRERLEKVRFNNGKIPQEMIDQMIKNMPDYCTYYSRIDIAENGLIYVYLNDVANKTAQEIDIFSPEGKYLYHATAKLPEGFIRVGPFFIKGNSLIIFVENEDGEQKLVKFQIELPTEK